MKNISVIGVGRLGLCFALTLEEAGYDVVGVDISYDYVNSLNNKTFSSSEYGLTDKLNESVNFSATTSIEKAIEHSDVLFVVVATPSLPDGRYDHRQIDNIIEELESLGRCETEKEFVVCCTTMPGYCDSIKTRLKKINYTVSYNPEFIAQGTILRDQKNPDIVLIGEGSKKSGDIIEEIYNNHTDNSPVYCRMSPTEAEITKISLNCFCTTKIAFANMIGDIVLKSGGNPDVVLNAIGSDSRVGSNYLKYGYGYGGPCFPRDNRALSLYASDISCPSEISLATDKSNSLHVIEQVNNFVKNNPDVEQEYVFDTVTYKKGTDIIEESQKLKFLSLLAQIGYDIVILENDINIVDSIKKSYGEIFRFRNVN